MDFNDVNSLKKQGKVLQESDIIVISWALNEAKMEPEFWNFFIENTKKAIVVVIEGAVEKLEVLKGFYIGGEILVEEFLEVPRRLIKLPK